MPKSCCEIRNAWFLVLSACLFGVSCSRQQFPSLTVVEPRSDRMVTLEDVKPNETSFGEFRPRKMSSPLTAPPQYVEPHPLQGVLELP